MTEIFDDNDAAYQAWIAKNPHGYVLNTRRRLNPSYMVLHRARCKSIQNYNRMALEGGFTERDFIKICALNREELLDWVAQNGRPDRTFSKTCGMCKP